MIHNFYKNVAKSAPFTSSFVNVSPTLKATLFRTTVPCHGALTSVNISSFNGVSGSRVESCEVPAMNNTKLRLGNVSNDCNFVN